MPLSRWYSVASASLRKRLDGRGKRSDAKRPILRWICTSRPHYGVPTDKCFLYPDALDALFEIYHAPADTFETDHTLGLPLYPRTIPDRDRDESVRVEIESNPLPICTRPQVLRVGKRT